MARRTEKEAVIDTKNLLTLCQIAFTMRFEWDEEKRRKNLQRHGIDFADVWQVFENGVITVADDRFDYGEIRFLTLGLLFGEVVAVSHTETDDIIRIISTRKAEKYEQKEYFREIRN